jgi:hypothetical protein
MALTTVVLVKVSGCILGRAQVKAFVTVDSCCCALNRPQAGCRGGQRGDDATMAVVACGWGILARRRPGSPDPLNNVACDSRYERALVLVAADNAQAWIVLMDE